LQLEYAVSICFSDYGMDVHWRAFLAVLNFIIGELMRMKQLALTLAVVLILSANAVRVVGDSFGSGPNEFSIEFVTIGNPGNMADTTGKPNSAGSVAYTYRIGKYEISADMVDKAIAAGGLDITHQNLGPNKPAFYIDWFEAAIFVNWLNESTHTTPAYKFNSEGDFQLWQRGDAGYDPTNRYRNIEAKYFLPSMDEWYKAAYYDADIGVYYDYPTGCDCIPDGFDFEGDTNFDAVFSSVYEAPLPNDITAAGVLSPYGTMGQGGNVWEWEETEGDLVNDAVSSSRGMRGGDWDNSFSYDSLSSLSRYPVDADRGGVGFRVASIYVPILSDFNIDGLVDGDDLVDPVLGWQFRFGKDLKGSDFLAWQRHFGSAAASANASMPVPEPVSMAILLVLVGLRLFAREPYVVLR
jgi:sulfatase-modifying factor enzyme 1